jgi:hypothetical protein
MSRKRNEAAYLPDPECGMPGGGRGRRDEVGGSGVYPASAGEAPPGAVKRMPAEWGQGDRGAEGYEDSGTSELFYYSVQVEAPDATEPSAGPPPAAEAEPEPARAESAARDSERARRSWGGW